MNIGLSEDACKEVSQGLSQFLANCYTLYVKLHNFHWDIHGPRFAPLHLAFEQQYEDLAAAVDEIAERIRALGHPVDASLASFKKQTEIEEKPGVPSEDEMIKQLLADHETIVRQGRKVATTAEGHADHATVDMLGRRLGVHEKFAWMLRSHF